MLKFIILLILLKYCNSCIKCLTFNTRLGLSNYHHYYTNVITLNNRAILSRNIVQRKVGLTTNYQYNISNNSIDSSNDNTANNDNTGNNDNIVNNDNINDNNEDVENSIKETMIEWIKWYKRTLSPMMPPNCRFLPTCSSYGIDSISKFGLLKGGILTAWRIMRCNPFGGSGYDPPQWPPPSFRAGSNTRPFF